MLSFDSDLIVVTITFFYLSLCCPHISLSDKQVPEATEKINSSLGSMVGINYGNSLAGFGYKFLCYMGSFFLSLLLRWKLKDPLELKT